MKKHFLIDLDGTLLQRPDLIFSANDVKAIKALKQAGHEFGIATGRAEPEIQFLLDQHQLRAHYFIALNGMVSHRQEYIQTLLNPKISQYLLESNIVFEAQDNQSRFFTTDAAKQVVKVPLGIPLIASQDIQHLPIKKIVIRQIDNQEDIQKIQKQLDLLFSADLEIFPIDGRSLEVVKKGISKGHAMQHLFNPSEYTVAIGDSDNDIELMKRSNQAYIMENADPHLIQAMQHYGVQTVKTVSDAIYQELSR